MAASMQRAGGMTDQTSDPTGQRQPAARRPTDEEVRAIAEQLGREAGAPPAASPEHHLSAQKYELAPADEERVDAALVELGAADPEDTIRAEREAAQEAAREHAVHESMLDRDR